LIDAELAALQVAVDFDLDHHMFVCYALDDSVELLAKRKLGLSRKGAGATKLNR